MVFLQTKIRTLERVINTSFHCVPRDSVMITIEGLVSLGYSKSEAAIAVNKVEDAKDLTPEELLKKALKNIMI